MNNKIFVIFIAVIVMLAIGGYFYWDKFIKNKIIPGEDVNALQKAGDAANIITENATQGVLPSINTDTNPLQDAPNINPVDKSNPFKDIKTNPFE